MLRVQPPGGSGGACRGAARRRGEARGGAGHPLPAGDRAHDSPLPALLAGRRTIFRIESGKGKVARHSVVDLTSRQQRRFPRPGLMTDGGVDHEADVDHSGEVDHRVFAAAEAVAVQPGPEHEIHAVPGHDHRREADDRAGCQTKVFHPAGIAGVQRDDVAEQGDQGPHLLGVPAPKAAPRLRRPEPAQHRAQEEQQDAHLDAAVTELRERSDQVAVLGAHRINARVMFPSPQARASGA